MAWTLPALGGVSSGYGPRKLAGAVSDFHYGTDLRAKRGPVYAAQDGVVRSIWKTAKGAWVVDVRHPDEDGRQIRTRYIHMYRDEIRVTVGQRVGSGQRIGLSGASGTAAAHLHFEVLVNNVNVDPEPFMAARRVHLDAQRVDAPVAVTPPPPVAPAPAPLPAPPAATSQEDDMVTLILFGYRSIIGREPSPEEVEARLRDFAGASLTDALAWFYNSLAEPATVQRAFLDFLRHNANQEQVAERTGWTARQVRENVYGSPEARGLRGEA